MAEAQATEASISRAREVYRSVAVRGSLLYFLVDSLSALDRVYHYRWGLGLGGRQAATKLRLLPAQMAALSTLFSGETECLGISTTPHPQHGQLCAGPDQGHGACSG